MYYDIRKIPSQIWGALVETNSVYDFALEDLR